MSEKVLLNKIEKLENENSSLVDINIKWLQKYNALQARNERYEKALREIKNDIDFDDNEEAFNMWDIARKALESEGSDA